MIDILILFFLLFGILVPICLDFILEFLFKVDLTEIIILSCYIATNLAFVNVFSLNDLIIVNCIVPFVWLFLPYGFVLIFEKMGFGYAFGKVVAIVWIVVVTTYLLLTIFC
ncbi:hypothetical protein IL099_000461 [Enterococcus hirae]|nr:hypothetical protein [Enterococcus hirae]